MTNKKTAVFGLYPTVDRAERAVDELVAARFDNADVSVLIADNQSSKDFAHEKQTKAPEARRRASPPVERLAARWDCWPASAPWRFPESDRSSRRGRLWARSRASVSGEPWAGWSAPWSVWESRSTRRSAMKAD